jgi:hypothetical protein
LLQPVTRLVQARPASPLAQVLPTCQPTTQISARS